MDEAAGNRRDGHGGNHIAGEGDLAVLTQHGNQGKLSPEEHEQRPGADHQHADQSCVQPLPQLQTGGLWRFGDFLGIADRPVQQVQRSVGQRPPHTDADQHGGGRIAGDQQDTERRRDNERKLHQHGGQRIGRATLVLRHQAGDELPRERTRRDGKYTRSKGQRHEQRVVH